ncbi:ABC transporter substrate-binding protein [Chloroflexota bacterium]
MKKAFTLFTLTILLVLSLVLAPACKQQPEPAPTPTVPPSPAPAPVVSGEFEISALTVTPSLVLPGEEATVEVDIANSGKVEGTLEAVLAINGVEMDTQPVTLAGGAKDKATFTVIRDIPGNYDISVGGQSVTLTVPEVANYNSEVYLYSISYPAEWQLDDANPDKVVMAQSGLADLGVSVSILSVGASLHEYYNTVLDSTREEFPDMLELSREEVREDGIVVAYDVMFAYTDREGNKIKRHMLFSKKGRYGFVAWGGAREDAYQQNESLLDACLKSFKAPEVAVDSYTDTTHGFSMTMPDGWDGLVTGQLMPFLQIRNPDSEPTVFTLVYVSRIFESTTVQDHALEIAAVWAEQPEYKIVSQGDVTLGGDTRGYEVVFTYTEGETAVKRKVVSVIRGTQVFILIPYTRESTYAEAQGSIDRLVNSFTLIEPKPFGVSRQNSLFLWEGEIVTLDPALSEDSPGGVIGALFSGLVRLDRNLKVVPDIAERWGISEDGTVYTFHLRKGVKFHDGKQVTAQDFKYSWERALDPKTESNKASTYLGDIAGAAEMLAGEAVELSGVRVIDDLTLEVTIDGPKPYFLDKLVYVTAYVVDRANVARGMNWTDKPNGTGPFELKEWKKDELLILERNNDYYLETPRLEHIVFQIFAGRQMMMYEQGEIDIARVYHDDFDKVLDPQNPLNRELYTTPSVVMGYLGFNVTMPPFDDAKVRRAFALALDVEKIIEVANKGNSERAAGFMPPGIPGHNEALKPIPFDVEQANQLIAESKYGSVDNLPPVVFYSLYQLGPADEAMIGMWQLNLGVPVEAEIVEELEEWFERSHRRELQLFSSGWQADYIDPQNFLEVLFHSQSEDNNFAYANAEVDDALEKAQVEQDEELRLKMYQDIEKLILADLPAAPFDQGSKKHMLVKPYIEGYYLAPIGIHVWKDISIKLR